jgi:hypothetical protein
MIRKLLLCLLLAQAAHGAVLFQAVSAIAASTGVDVTVTLPAHQANDVFLLLGWVRDVDDTVTVTGWTSLGSIDRGTTSRYFLFWIRAASGSVTNPLFDKSGTTGDTYAMVATYRGAFLTGDPWEVVGLASTGTADPAPLNGISTLTDGALVVAALGGENNNNVSVACTATDPSTMTAHYDESVTGTDGMIAFCENNRTTLGATGTVNVDFNVAVPVGWGGVVMALKPATTAGGPRRVFVY